jgi:hypothetical protein
VYGVRRGKPAGVAKRPRELVSHPKSVPLRFATFSPLYASNVTTSDLNVNGDMIVLSENARFQSNLLVDVLKQNPDLNRGSGVETQLAGEELRDAGLLGWASAHFFCCTIEAPRLHRLPASASNSDPTWAASVLQRLSHTRAREAPQPLQLLACCTASARVLGATATACHTRLCHVVEAKVAPCELLGTKAAAAAATSTAGMCTLVPLGRHVAVSVTHAPPTPLPAWRLWADVAVDAQAAALTLPREAPAWLQRVSRAMLCAMPTGALTLTLTLTLTRCCAPCPPVRGCLPLPPYSTHVREAERESGPGGLTREVETPLPSKQPT